MAFVDPVEIKAFMDMHGYPFGFGLSPFNLPRYPPGMGARIATGVNPGKLKEKVIRDDQLFSAKLHDYSKMYLRRASNLMEMNPIAFPVGHPMNSQGSDMAVEEENEKLRKENLELRKRIEQMTKNKQHV
jgi:hypothetical protein